jgi:DNA-binding YbaB/EbfC family protein
MDTMDQLLEHAQKVQQDIEKAEIRLKSVETSCNSGAGMVTCRMNVGDKKVLEIRINDKSLFEDQAMLIELVIAAVNLTYKKADAIKKEEMNKITGPMPIPMF